MSTGSRPNARAINSHSARAYSSESVPRSIVMFGPTPNERIRGLLDAISPAMTTPGGVSTRGTILNFNSAWPDASEPLQFIDARRHSPDLCSGFGARMIDRGYAGPHYGGQVRLRRCPRNPH